MKNFSISKRHNIYFLLLIAIPTILVMTIVGFVYRSQLVLNTRLERQYLLDQTAVSLNQDFDIYSIMAASIINNRNIIDNCSSYSKAKTDLEKYPYSRELDTDFEKFLQMTKVLTSIHIYFEDDSHYFFRNHSINQIRDEDLYEWFNKTQKDQNSILFIDTINELGDAQSRPVLTSVVSPSDKYFQNNPVKMLLLSLDVPQFTSFLHPQLKHPDANSEDGFLRLVVNQNDEIIASSNNDYLNTDYSEFKESSNVNVILLESEIAASSWKLVDVIDSRQLTKAADRIMINVYIAVILILVLFILYNTSFFKSIIAPLNLVGKEMEIVSKGDFTARLTKYKNFNEYNSIVDNFNLMVSDLDSLTKKISLKEKERAKLEIEALRFQLNPHFLCNTLNSIKILSSIENIPSVERMTAALIKVMEDNLRNGDRIWSIEHEIRNLESYLYIMKVRYGDIFDFKCDISDQLLSYGIPSMTFQPIIENSILHGLRGLEKEGLITLSGSAKDNKLCFTITDNGFGMSNEVLEKLSISKDGKSGMNHIGLYNVHKRIALDYGDEFGLNVSSVLGEGTVVEIVIPILDVEKND